MSCGTTAISVTLSVTDTTPTTGTRTVGMQVIDPSGTFAITVPPSTPIPAAGGATVSFTAPVSAAFGNTVNWSITSITPTPATGTITLTSSTGTPTTLTATGTVPAGSYTVGLSATDSSTCGGPSHAASATYTLVKQ